MAFDEIKNQTEQIQEHAQEYVKTNLAYYKLRAFKLVMQSTTIMVKFLLIGLFLSLVLLFVSLAAAFAIGNYLDNTALGFLIVGGGYLVATVFLFLLKDKIIEGPILKKFSTLFFTD